MSRLPTLLAITLSACSGCPAPPTHRDASLTDSACPASTAVVLNTTAVPTTVYASFGSNSQVGPADWPFCTPDASGCSFPLPPSASQLLPSAGQALNVTLAFGQAPGCGTTLAEVNFNIPGWSEDTANISLVNGWNTNVSIAVADAATLGPTEGPDGNADVYGVYPVACDLCVSRGQPPCGQSAAGCTTPGSCGCKTGTQYNPTVPCRARRASRAARW